MVDDKPRQAKDLAPTIRISDEEADEFVPVGGNLNVYHDSKFVITQNLNLNSNRIKAPDS